MTSSEYAKHHVGLVAALVERGELPDERWRAAFQAVPRHWFVPAYYEWDTGGYRRVDGADPAQRDEWLTGIGSDRVLVTYLVDGNTASSSSQPSLMAAMLHALEVEDGQRVLEVGTVKLVSPTMA